MNRPGLMLGLLGTTALLSGCAGGMGAPGRSPVLDGLHAGLVSMEAGNVANATAQVSQALTVVNIVHRENANGPDAQSVWNAEHSKVYAGEPYERAMANYYMGVLDLMSGNYEGAHASFRKAQEVGDGAPRPDMAVLPWLQGWAARCRGMLGAGEKSFAEAAHLNPLLTKPSEGDDTLVLFETGSAPIKARAGNRGQFLAYLPGSVASVAASLSYANGNRDTMVPAADLYHYAATTNRQADLVNANKANVQDGTHVVGQVGQAAGLGLLAASANMSGRDGRNMAIAGGAALLVGLVADIASSNMHPEADVRRWDNMSSRISVQTVKRLEAGTVTVNGRVLPVQAHEACGIAWGRQVPATAVGR